MGSRDNLGIFGQQDDSTGELDVDALRRALADNSAVPPSQPRERSQRSRMQRASRQAARNRRRRRLRQSLVALVVLALIGGGVFVLVRNWSDKTTVIPDYAGAGTTETVIRVKAGDGALAVANTLMDSGVIASTAAFVTAAEGNANYAALQKGYFKVRQAAGVNETIAALLDPANRVGQVELIAGGALADVTVPADATTGTAGSVIPGYLTQLTEAACIPLNGVRNCFTADQLWEVEKTASVADLGLVSWAQAAVQNAPEPARRLEGMILPGIYNVPPGNDPVAVLKSVLSQSATDWLTSNIEARSQALGYSSYQLVVIASIVEKEASKNDMPRVARVIFNRLEGVAASSLKPLPLQMDSTINYLQNTSKLATDSVVRQTSTSPYNTYKFDGLPPTPIAAPGHDAVDAALNPAAGEWQYFVAVGTAGKSCFSVTYEEHQLCGG